MPNFGRRVRPGIPTKDLIQRGASRLTGSFGPTFVDHLTGLVLVPAGAYTDADGTWDWYDFTSDAAIRCVAHGIDPTWGDQYEGLAVPGGGGNGGGGAGAGGGPPKQEVMKVAVDEVIRIKIGAGGPGATPTRGTRGSPTSIGALATDGGGEAAQVADGLKSDWSGPGAGGGQQNGVGRYGGLNSNGFWGGKGSTGSDDTQKKGGGGAGGGQDGTDATNADPGDGGDGFESSITGVAKKYGPGGGGGAKETSSTGGVGGDDDGAKGYGSDGPSENGPANTGAGAGGDFNVARSGGSGRAIIRVKRAA